MTAPDTSLRALVAWLRDEAGDHRHSAEHVRACLVDGIDMVGIKAADYEAVAVRYEATAAALEATLAMREALTITTGTLKMLLDGTGQLASDDGRLAGAVRAAIDVGDAALERMIQLEEV